MTLAHALLPRRDVLALALGASVLAPSRPAHAQDPAAALALQLYERPAGRDFTAVVQMELAERGREPRIRRLVLYRKNRSRGESSVLIRFLEPRDIAGLGLLSVNHADGDSDQSLFLPELDRVRKVSGDRKGGRFVGSDLYFEDLQERTPSRDRHRLLGAESINGVVCERLESEPVEAGDSVYLKRIAWVDPKTLLAHRVDYYERDVSAPSKRLQVAAFKQAQRYWTITDSTVTDLRTGHRTRMLAEQLAYDRNLPSRLFTTQALADEAFESEYRP